MNKEDYNDYRAKGGILTRGSIRASYNQAESMADRAEIKLTEAEKQMYVFLRMNLKRLSDQCLMAEVLLMTNHEELGKFIDRWPNIFKV